MTPKVSVIIPAHNMADTIMQSIESALHQSYSNLEVVVVDDSSSDGTTAILAKVNDQRLCVIRMPTSCGPSAARNAGIRAASSDFIALLDADDVWLPTKLIKQVALFQENPSLGLVYCGAHTVDQELHYLRTSALGKTWPPPGAEAFRRVALRQSDIAAPLSSMLVKRECFDEVGFFDEEIVQAEEWDLAFRLAHRWGIAFVPEPLVLYRMTGYFNPQKRLGRRIGQAHETTIERAFARLGDPPELKSLKMQALLDTWWVVALYQYSVHEPDLAVIELEKAASVSPNYLDFESNDHLKTSFAYVAWSLYDTITPLNEALAFVDYVFDHFPPLVRTSSESRHKVKAEVCAITAFDSYPRGERSRVWKAACLALLLDPSLVRNRGLLKLPFRAMARHQAVPAFNGENK